METCLLFAKEGRRKKGRRDKRGDVENVRVVL